MSETPPCAFFEPFDTDSTCCRTCGWNLAAHHGDARYAEAIAADWRAHEAACATSQQKLVAMLRYLASTMPRDAVYGYGGVTFTRDDVTAALPQDRGLSDE